MKKWIQTVCVLAAAAGMFACSNHKMPRFEILAFDTVVGNAQIGCDVKYRFTSIANAAKSEVLTAIERSNLEYFYGFDSYDGPSASAARESLGWIENEIAEQSRICREMNITPAAGERVVKVDSEAGVTDSLLNYGICRSTYLGGAHGMEVTEYHTYSLTDGYELGYKELFREDRLEDLQIAIHKKICEKYETEESDLSDAGFFSDPIAVTDNFRLTSEGLTFHYNPYEVGCYALGSVTVEFDWEELAEFLK